MILVLLGTQHNSFERLLKEIEKCIEQNVIKEEVIVQAGHTKFESKNMKIVDMVSMQELNNLIIKANLIITHGGVGSITTALKNNKKIIAVPRLKKYGEHVNDHQLQIVESFAENGYLKKVIDIEDLPKVIQEIEEFAPNKFVSNTGNIIKIIAEYIER
jgi:UDP-N-acetylglucosamine transferase subunit ALG13